MSNSEEYQNLPDDQTPESVEDGKADAYALFVIFWCMVGMAVHWVSGFSFDF